jgi:hypothetical protein
VLLLRCVLRPHARIRRGNSRHHAPATERTCQTTRAIGGFRLAVRCRMSKMSSWALDRQVPCRAVPCRRCEDRIRFRSALSENIARAAFASNGRRRRRQSCIAPSSERWSGLHRSCRVGPPDAKASDMTTPMFSHRMFSLLWTDSVGFQSGSVVVVAAVAISYRRCPSHRLTVPHSRVGVDVCLDLSCLQQRKHQQQRSEAYRRIASHRYSSSAPTPQVTAACLLSIATMSGGHPPKAAGWIC